MAENRELPERTVHEVVNNPVKLDQVRNITGGTLLRTIPANQQTRFVMAAPVQSSTALISTTSTIQAQVLPKATVQGSAQTQMNRINPAVPIQATSTTGYHVPRGAAAVANIAVPRSSVATPMVRGPATLQTIGVATAPTHPIAAGTVATTGPIVGRSVVGVTPWVATCLAQQATSRQTPPPSQHLVRPSPPSTQQIQVNTGSRLVSGQMRPVGETSQQTRPVLLHATHKQLTLTQQAHLQSFVDGVGQQSNSDKPMTVKSYGGASCSQGNRNSSGATAGLSRLTTALPPAVVSLQPAVIVPTTQTFPIKGTTTTQAKVITQQTHGTTTMQISTVPVSSVQPTIAINSVVSRPVMLANQATTSGGGSTTAPSAVTMRGIAAAQQHVKVYSNNQSSSAVGNSNTSSNPGAANISVADATGPVSAPVYIHAAPHKPGVNPQAAQPGAILVRPPHHQVKDSTDHPGLLPSSQGMRINSVMVVDSSRVQVHPFVAASEGVTMVADGGIAPTAMGTISITGSLSHSLMPKQNTSPRPSILRKRDPPEGSPMKAQKNLTPVLANMASSGSISSSCSVSPPPANPCSTSVATPGSPRLSESTGIVGSGQCSSGSSGAGSTTLSANSSPGESPPIKLESQDDLDNTTAPPVVATPTVVHQHQEMSPRKKPRKQQLTGNQITEPAFSEDEMEFISDEKIKTDHKADENEEKCLPKKTMSLLNGYRHPWKSRNNHFLRYSDLRPKEERKPTLSELANQKHALQKLNGWKIYHLNSQMEDMVNSETEFFGLYTSLLSSLEIKQKKCKNKDIDREISRINERIRANFQRSKVVKDQIQEAKQQVMKLFEHKSYVADIINRNVTKRPVKKRDRI
ncbi:sin3A-associated protein 130 isoform X2 [Rhodnius prolixus]